MEARRNRINGLRNSEVFLEEIERRVRDEKTVSFSIFVYEITNTNKINRYLDYSYGRDAIIHSVREAEGIFHGSELFSIYTNEIAVILDHVGLEMTWELGERLLDVFSDPIMINEMPVHVRLNGGVVMYPDHGSNPEDLYRNMGRSLSQCGSEEGVISIYSEKATMQVKGEYSIKQRLYNAMKNDELRLEYQPKYNATTNEVTGAEALLRWDGTDKNIAEVIDIAEKTNLINSITKWVARKATQQLREWKEEGLNTRVSINVSPKDLTNDTFLRYLLKCVEDAGISEDMIEIEITERCVFENKENIAGLLNMFKEYGFSISIDDYGTGYNSLKNVLVFPYHNIKIDKFFIDNLENSRSYSLIEGIIKTSTEVGIDVIAEGVETESQYMILNDLGCEIIQGYYISRPLKPDVYKERWLYVNTI